MLIIKQKIKPLLAKSIKLKLRYPENPKTQITIRRLGQLMKKGQVANQKMGQVAAKIKLKKLNLKMLSQIMKAKMCKWLINMGFQCLLRVVI